MVVVCPGMTTAPKTYACVTTHMNQLSCLHFQCRKKCSIFMLHLYIHKWPLTIVIQLN